MRASRPGPVAGDDLEDVVRALVVGEDLHLGREREVLQLPRHAARRRAARAAPARRAARASSNSTNWIVSRYDALGLRRIEHREGVERVAVARGVDLGFDDATARRARRSRRCARTGPSGRAGRSAPAGLRRSRARRACTTGSVRVDAPVAGGARARRSPRRRGAGSRRCRAAPTARPRRRPARAYRRSRRRASACALRCCPRSCASARRRAGRARVARNRSSSSLRLPGVPHLRAGAADVGDGQQVERDQAPLGADLAREGARSTSGSDRSCFCAVDDMVRWCSTSQATSSASSRGRPCSRQKRRASRAPSVRMVAAAALGDVVEQRRRGRAPRGARSRPSARAQRIFVRVLRPR